MVGVVVGVRWFDLERGLGSRLPVPVHFLFWSKGRGAGGNFSWGDPLKHFPGSLVSWFPPFPLPRPVVSKEEKLFLAIVVDVILHGESLHLLSSFVFSSQWKFSAVPTAVPLGEVPDADHHGHTQQGAICHAGGGVTWGVGVMGAGVSGGVPLYTYSRPGIIYIFTRSRYI